MAIVIRECGPDLLPALKLFWARMYRSDHVLCRDEKLFKWQFLGPAGAPGDAFNLKLAVIDGEIVGSLGYIPIEASIDREVVRGGWLVNWVVDPERRRFGLGPLLMREVTRRFDVGLNAGPNQDARSILARMAWTDLGTLTRYVLVLDVDAAATLTQSGRLDWRATDRLGSDRAGRASVRPIERFATETTDVWDRLAPHLGAGTRRSAEYLNWRYIGHPVWRYRCFEVRRGGRLKGVAVYRIEQVRDRVVRLGRIVELVGEEADATALLEGIVSDAQIERVAALDFFCSSPLLTRAMHCHGFVSGADSPAASLPMLLQPLDHRRTSIHFMAHLAGPWRANAVKHWYVTKSDADQDRPN